MVCQETTVEANWPLVIPPILTLMDDESTECKIKGCELLTTFLGVIPPLLLERTGLGQVFQEAHMQCLSYLPSLTTEGESLQLLGAVYPTRLSLVHARFPGTGMSSGRTRVLDSIMRTGILRGFAHAGENVKIAELLVKQASFIVDGMGIESIKHLKVRMLKV